MGLKLKLKPRERVFLNGALIRNGESGAELELMNPVPLLRERDIMLESAADTPCKRLYLLVQTMYFDPVDKEAFLRSFQSLGAGIAEAAPSMAAKLAPIGGIVRAADYYPALRRIRELIDYESTLIEHAKQSK